MGDGGRGPGPRREADELAGGGGGGGGGEERAEGVGGGGADGLAADEELAGDGGGGDDAAVGFFEGGVVGEAGEDDVRLGDALVNGCDDGCFAGGPAWRRGPQLARWFDCTAGGACLASPFPPDFGYSPRVERGDVRTTWCGIQGTNGRVCLTYTTDVAQTHPH